MLFYEIDKPGTSINTTLRITGYGADTGADNLSQQTHALAVNTNVTTTISYNIDTEGYNSGSPIIDENTGRVIGVHTKPGCPNSGTTFRKTDFWNRANKTGTYSTQLNQKRESGSQLSGSTIGEWTVSSFTNHTISGTLPYIGSISYGELITLKGSQGLVSSPIEKYNRWIQDTEDLMDVSNHREFLIRSNSILTSQFKKVYNATLKNNFPEVPSLDPSSDVVEFKDPWLIDYNDSEYGNNTRNRGYFATF